MFSSLNALANTSLINTSSQTTVSNTLNSATLTSQDIEQKISQEIYKRYLGATYTALMDMYQFNSNESYHGILAIVKELEQTPLSLLARKPNQNSTAGTDEEVSASSSSNGGHSSVSQLTLSMN